jgi:hypothetical protein
MTKRNRRRVGLMLLLLTPAMAGADFKYDVVVPIEPRVEKAIGKAQAWLVARQQKNGGWGNNAETALAVIALMVNGNTPGKGKYGVPIAKGVENLLATQRQDGLLVGRGGPNGMYEHGLSMLALAEAYGMTHNPEIRDGLIRAVDLVVRVQSTKGGWRYEPRPGEQDLSVTVTQVMGLRAAAEAGIYIPEVTIRQAIRYIEGGFHKEDATFNYYGDGRSKGTFACTGAGVVSMVSVGRYDSDKIPKAAETLLARGVDALKGYNHGASYWYGQYYCSAALYYAGGEAWKNYYSALTERVLKNWEGAFFRHGDVVANAFAVIALGTPHRYLPVYQR